MKVKELINKLKEFNQELEIVVNGYEGGCGNPSIVEEINIKNNCNTEGWCGPHEEIYPYEDLNDLEGTLKEFVEQGGVVSKAVIIRR